MKVKIFASDVRKKDNDLAMLETEINLWLAANPDITVYSVDLSPLDQSVVCVVSYYDDMPEFMKPFTFSLPAETN